MDKIFSPIKQRITEYINYKGITKESFYNKTGISSSNFKGRAAKSELGGDKLANILTNYPDIHAKWLITGRGFMLVKDSQKGEVSDFTPLEISEHIANNEELFLNDKTFNLVIKALYYTEYSNLEQKINDLEKRLKKSSL